MVGSWSALLVRKLKHGKRRAVHRVMEITHMHDEFMECHNIDTFQHVINAGVNAYPLSEKKNKKEFA